MAGDPISGQGVELVVTDLTVSGHLSADGLGYTPQQNGPGAPGDSNSGAGHGGVGGGLAGGATYGSMTEPETLGSAGFDQYRANGGGAIEIIAAGTVLIEDTGRISADSVLGEFSAADGAGGSIWIKASDVLGNGTISARGSASYGTPGGGGGRIAVYADQVSPGLTFDVKGGYSEPEGNGTIFFGGIDPQQSTIAIVPETIPTDGESTATVTVTIRDGGGNPIEGEPVELGLTLGQELFIEDLAVLVNDFVSIGPTDANGQATATVYAEIIGERTLQARSGQVLLTQAASVQFVPGPVSAATSRIWAEPQVAPADGVTPVQISVQARDQFLNMIPGLTVEITSTGSTEIDQPAEPTALNGMTSGSITDSVREKVTVSAIIDGVPMDASVEVSFTGADLDLGLTGPEVTAPGAILTYQLELRNIGELRADAVTLVQTLPPEVVYEFQNAPVEPVQTDNQLTWSLGDLDVDGRVLFNVGVRVPEGTPFGTLLETSVEATTTSGEPDLSNNSAVHSMEVVDGNQHSVSIATASKTVGLGGEATFKVIIVNTGLLGDRFTLGLVGLDQDWYTIEPPEVALSPGGSAEVPLVVQVDECGLDGEYEFTVQATSATTGGVETVAGTLILQTAPVISALQPDSGVELGSRDVSFAWHSDAPSEGTLTVWPFGDQTSKQVFYTEEGTEHSLVVEGLERDTTYVWQVQASSVCGVSASPERQFTVTNGVVFSDHSIDVTIDRDYDQRFSVNIVNTDVVAHTVKLDVLNPYEDLILNFIGLGSRDEWITLLPGEASTVQMAVHAQDADLRNYQLTAVVQSDELGDPIRDTATLDIRVLFDADFTIEEVSRDPVSEEVTYRIVNRGTTLTDLSIKAVDPVTGDPAQVFLSPAISHALLGTDDSLEFTVFPLFGPEDVGEPQVNLGGNALMSVLRDQGAVNFDLLVEAGGAIRNFVGTIDCWASGKQVYPLALDQVVLTCSGGDWYCTNRPDIEIPFPMPWFARPETILRSSLAASFRPSQEALPHTVNLKFNSRSIGSPSDPIPTGTYRFSVPASAFKGTFEAGTIEQTLSLHSDHPNNAHYTVATGFKLQASLEGAMMYVCASSPEEVSQAASGVCDMSALASDMSVAITWPKDETQIQPPANGLVNIQANIFDDVDPFVDQYEVEATVEYLDPSAEGIEDEMILLFNDGLIEHKDLQAGDRFYNAMWKPQAGGSVRITVSAIGLAPGLEDSDSITIDLNVLPDFSVERVWQNEVSLFNQKAQVHAEVKNNGFP
ncbi:MAG: invasin domain 3-containing protein, partial [Anaerolineales bacterium]